MGTVQKTSLSLAAFLALALPVLAAPTLDGITYLGGTESADAPLVQFLLGDPPCDGNNHANGDYFDPAFMGGPMIGIQWFPTVSADIMRVEIFSGEVPGVPNQVAIWSDDGAAPSRPLDSLGWSAPFAIDDEVAWYGADLNVPVSVVGGDSYWIVWDPTGNEQVSATDSPGDIIQNYWGSGSGDVTGGASWSGPFSFPDRRWKFRVYCNIGGCPDSDDDDICDEDDLCAGTVVPEFVPWQGLGVNRWALVDDDDVFDTRPPNGHGPKVSFTLEDTAGCSCEQVIETLGIGRGHEKYGCSTGVMRRFTALAGH